MTFRTEPRSAWLIASALFGSEHRIPLCGLRVPSATSAYSGSQFRASSSAMSAYAVTSTGLPSIHRSFTLLNDPSSF
jgi:hypothetical protein